MTPSAPDILARIVSRKREELRLASLPANELRLAGREQSRSRRDFAGSLRLHQPAIISEIKKASPSRGVLTENFHPDQLARSYEAGGAAALSVLTDEQFFQGSAEDLRSARAACSLPVLRKDFTIAENQIFEAAAMGADAILLIAAILDLQQLRQFRELAASFAMAALVEVHDERELQLALDSGAEIIGVNNRDLRTFTVSLETSLTLAKQIPAGILKVSESGIFTAQDVQCLAGAGYDAFLVGEHLMKSGDPSQALKELVA